MTSATSPVIPINSLTIYLHGHGHSKSECKSTTGPLKTYSEVLSKLTLKCFEIYWDSRYPNLDCSAVQFVKNLLREKVSQLDTLNFQVDQGLLHHFDQVWDPPRPLPKLKAFNLGINTIQLVGDRREDNFIHKIIQHAPNLTKIGGKFNSELL